MAGLLAGPGRVLALESIVVNPRVDRIEITTKGEIWDNRGDSLQVETAAGLDGVVGRMDVKASTSGTNPNWIVFALTNRTDRHIERWLTADRYNSVGSGGVWPDLDARRISAVTPSIGFVPERVKSDRADVFRITLEPGQTITFVAELSSERFARIFLWKPLAYELKVRERQLFNGVLLGLTGLMAIFLTAIFAANHKAIFPTAALFAWCVLVYLCVDFGFFHKLFSLRPEDNAVYRAAGEASIAASLVIFLFTFLRLGYGHGLLRMLFGVWILAQLALIAVAVVDPRLSATFARLSFMLIGGAGAVIIGVLAARGQDRAMSIIPTWLLFLVWIFATAVTLTGRMSGDIVVTGLAAGLVLIVVLIGFTVTQFAFRSLEPAYGAAPDEQQLRALAVDGVGASTWEWSARRDEIKVSPILEAQLGLNGGELSTKVEDFLQHVHTSDRERFRLVLWSIQERAGGRIRLDFRLRHSDNSYRWYELEAASVESADRRNVRCVGLLRDITDTKRTHERLLEDAVNCRVTRLPNKEIFLDRLSVASQRAKDDPDIRPTIMFIDLDRFRRINAQLGLVVGDSLLLTIARRLQRHLEPDDTLARISGDQFAVLLLRKQDPRDLAALAERIRRSLRSPITIVAQEVILTGSLGIAIYEGDGTTPEDLLKGAEIAMYRAKRKGADRIEIFHPDMRMEGGALPLEEKALRKALEAKQVEVFYQPIVYLPTEELAGFEAVLRWEHPTLKTVRHEAIVEIAEKSDLIRKVGAHLLLQSLESAKQWQKLLPRTEAPLFASVNISNCQIFRSEVVDEWRQILGRRIVPSNCIRLEITEALAMESPERAIEMMRVLEAAGAEIILDEFGAGYTSIPYLKRFPAETIKIDKSIVQAGTDGEGDGAAVVRSVASLADELGKRVVAEGVEIEDDVIFLRAIGCEYGQGLYYGEPMSEAEAFELIKVIAKSERKLEAPVLFKTRPKKAKKKAAQKTEQPMAPEAAVSAAPTSVRDPQANGKGSGIASGKSGADPKRNGAVANGTSPQEATRQQDNGRGGDGAGKAADQSNAPRPNGEEANLEIKRVLSSLPNVTVRPLERAAAEDKPVPGKGSDAASASASPATPSPPSPPPVGRAQNAPTIQPSSGRDQPASQRSPSQNPPSIGAEKVAPLNVSPPPLAASSQSNGASPQRTGPATSGPQNTPPSGSGPAMNEPEKSERATGEPHRLDTPKTPPPPVSQARSSVPTPPSTRAPAIQAARALEEASNGRDENSATSGAVGNPASNPLPKPPSVPPAMPPSQSGNGAPGSAVRQQPGSAPQHTGDQQPPANRPTVQRPMPTAASLSAGQSASRPPDPAARPQQRTPVSGPPGQASHPPGQASQKVDQRIRPSQENGQPPASTAASKPPVVPGAPLPPSGAIVPPASSQRPPAKGNGSQPGLAGGAPGGRGAGDASGQPPDRPASAPQGVSDDLARLSPGIAASLARLAGKTGNRKPGVGGPVSQARRGPDVDATRPPRAPVRKKG
ncbi:MAG: EAL domain-containing protein [Alphaproteobacteria bacterium]|nr:EAL domain-containing protein [Alphaproteobacteria bacterium]